MPISKVGYLIKQRRETLGYTQEELADGICAVTTLSRIENGERLPTKNHYERLFQRLGLSDLIYYTYVDERTLQLHELRFRIRHLLSLKQHEDAKELLEAYACSADMDSPIEKQFVLLCGTIADQNTLSPEERLSRFTEAISLSCPKYEEGIYPALLSYEEIIILNNMATCHWQMNNLDEAIHILSYVKQYYERDIMNQEEILKTQTMILYNLSKFLGLAERYDACIETCDLGIKIARETGRCGNLSDTLYNKAWSLCKRRLPGDMELAEKAVKEALFAAFAMDDKEAAEHYIRFYKEHFPQSDLLLDIIHGPVT